ncbi:hypothetical protein ACFDR9_002957 [Janthinobacterium sp. CG_23.3]|nr:hypothetical protein [Janthinobacterium sp. CG3]
MSPPIRIRLGQRARQCEPRTEQQASSLEETAASMEPSRPTSWR